ncbi:MAG: NAD(P)H-binding protein, partial [Chromatiaceae bacterium]|nr:NAD(P)H-binding protein [Chromatiaceae bacterium]
MTQTADQPSQATSQVERERREAGHRIESEQSEAGQQAECQQAKRERGDDASAGCLVFGASGYIGSHLVPRLLDEGIRVRASSRNPSVLKARGWEGVDCVAADALDPASLDQALAGIEIAYYLVHSMAAGKDFGRIDLEAAANFAAAAERAGVKRIVYLGGLVPDDA